jgi:transcriptional regulator with XRE-family HTH domain
MTDVRELLASNMKKLREILGLSQAKLAEKVDTASNYIALIETGKRFPSPQMIQRIAAALQVDTPELFALETSEKTSVSVIRSQILADIDKVLDKRLSSLIEKSEQ